MQRQYGRWYRSASTQRMIRHSRRRHIRHACISQNKVLRDRCYYSYQYSTVNVAYIESFQRYSQMLQKNKHFYTPILLNLLFIMWSVHWRLGQWCAIKIYILHNITELPYPQPAPPKKRTIDDDLKDVLDDWLNEGFMPILWIGTEETNFNTTTSNYTKTKSSKLT